MIIGHKKQWEFLENSFKNEKLAHAFLFCGENKIGKKTFAIEFVKLLNCSADKKPCNICKNCLDIEKGNFPDFLFVHTGEESAVENNFEGMFSYSSALPDLKTGQELKDKKEIEISQARKVLEFLSLRSYFASYKAVIIDNAEKLNMEAQNCLLKTLEEAKGKTILILVTSQPERLLSTIFSRCQTIKFFPVPAKEIAQHLVGIGCLSKKAEELADMADGKAGKAISDFKNPEKLEEEQKILNDLLKVISQNLAEKFAYAKSLKDEDGNIKEILEILQKYFRYLLLQKIGACPTPPGFYPEPTENIKLYSVEKLKDIIKQIERTINDISFTNVNQKLAFEILLMEI
jgi:DNA polymerase-3 subunit delta'